MGNPVNVVMPDHASGIAMDDMNAKWSAVQYPQLSLVLVHLRYVSMLHQFHRWTAKGDPFYGDHKLFEQLYEATLGEVDKVAEKAVGLGSAANVDLNTQLTQIAKVAASHGATSTIPQQDELARKSLVAEMTLLKCITAMIFDMREKHVMTQGVENMLQGICDTHEGHVYLLKQRCAE